MATWIPESASHSPAGLGRATGWASVPAALVREPAALVGLVLVAGYPLTALTAGILPLPHPLQGSAQRPPAPEPRLSLRPGPPGAGLPGRRSRDRGEAGPHRAAADRAEPALDPDRASQPRALVVGADRGRAVFPRALRATPGAVVGRDAQRGAPVPRVRDAPRPLPGDGDHGRRPRIQPARRRSARRAGPAAAVRIANATRREVDALAKLMAASPLLRRYRVSEDGARASLSAALRRRGPPLVRRERGTNVRPAVVLAHPAP